MKPLAGCIVSPPVLAALLLAAVGLVPEWGAGPSLVAAAPVATQRPWRMGAASSATPQTMTMNNPVSGR